MSRVPQVPPPRSATRQRLPLPPLLLLLLGSISGVEFEGQDAIVGQAVAQVSGCADSTTWAEVTHPTWNCATYAVGASNDGYCTDVDDTGVTGTIACPVSCNSCPPPAPPPPSPPPPVSINVQITSFSWANEITWNVDGGNTFGPYDDNSTTDQILLLSEDDHTLNYFDAYGDGWHGGYWSIIDPADGWRLVAGGPTDGVVEGAGGSEDFTLGAGGTVTAAAQVAITVHISTLTWANEITWSIDDGQTFGVSPVFADNYDYYEALVLPEGDHAMRYFDAYGDGWHGGYWEIFPGTLTAADFAGRRLQAGAALTPIAGGPVAGQVTGAGGMTSFTLTGTNAQVNVQITSFSWANEITWNVDGGNTFGPYDDNSTTDQILLLSEDDHTLNYFDAYGDGWHGGYWSIINPADGSLVAGGVTEGLVTDAGGTAVFMVAAGDPHNPHLTLT